MENNYSGKVRQFMASFVLLKMPESQARTEVILLSYCSCGLN